MTEPDETLTRIGQGVELGQRGERAAARRLFAEIWQQVAPTGDALHRVGLAHAMADVQDDVNEELAWDLRALEAAESVTDKRADEAGVLGPVAGLYPSLHLNLGEDYRKLGDLRAARHHLELGQQAAQALGDDGYGRMIRGGLVGLAARLDES